MLTLHWLGAVLSSSLVIKNVNILAKRESSNMLVAPISLHTRAC